MKKNIVLIICVILFLSIFMQVDTIKLSQFPQFEKLLATVVFIIGAIFGKMLPLNSKNLQSYKKQYEKISVSNEEQNDRVKILEEKIKSLEIALEKALEK